MAGGPGADKPGLVVIGAFIKALGQLGDRAIRRAVWISLGLSATVMAGLWTALAYMLTATQVFQSGWLEAAADLLGGAAAVVFTWLLFPAVISAFIGLQVEGIARAVEARHYPGLPPARGESLASSMLTAARFSALMVALNLIALVFLVVPPLFPFVFLGLNGYLLSREYFELVAHRRIRAGEARALRKAHRASLFAFGVVIAALLTVPGVNLLTPVVATAAMVHLFEAWYGAPAQQSQGE